jgi:O-antigen ligase
MIRLSALAVVVTVLAVYAWKDWFKSLCGLILLMVVVEHPDMPKSLLGIQGLNPWNLLLLDVVLAWAVSRRRERLIWDMPRHVNVLLLLYLGVVLVGFFRLMAVREILPSVGTTRLAFTSEYFVNTVKWVIPGLLLFDGCRSRPRFLLGLFSVLAVYFLLAVLVIRWMPPESALSGESLGDRSVKILQNEIGYHRVNLSMMLAGASWAIFAARSLPRRRLHQSLIVVASVLVVYAQALTGGRTGYGTWAAIGFVLCVVRWRRYLLLAPLVVVLVVVVVPGVAERALEGFLKKGDARAATQGAGAELGEPDWYTVTAGRNVIWPYVIARIGEAPVLGYGREAMRRTGLASFLIKDLGESFPHPHNAYLEMLLDNGLVGFVLVMPFYLVVLVQGLRLFRDSRSRVFVAIGGVACALTLALLIASIGSQTFYPREGSVGMWCAIGLLFRVSVQRGRVLGRLRGPAALRRAPADARPGAGAGDIGPPIWTSPSESRPGAGAMPSLESLLWKRTA